MIKAGITGGAGYVAGELLRLLINHPETEITFVDSHSHVGNPVAAVHTGLEGETELVFSDRSPLETIDILFLCTPHGESKKFLERQIPENLRIIDLSTDFRIKSPSHDFVYGLPELNRDEIRTARRIANPGCFATAIQLALLPLAHCNRLDDDVHIHALTGSTGAGAIPSETTHFSWRHDNISIYKPFEHQHLKEIRQSLSQLQPSIPSLNFIPVRGDFTRGIFATAYLKVDISLDRALEIYHDYYRTHPFVHISAQSPSLKQVVNTNKCLLHLHKNGNLLLITSMIDNLLKGASGQAVHNMNLLCGFDELLGLRLKPSAF